VRRKLGDDAAHPRYPLTVRGVGYRMTPAHDPPALTPHPRPRCGSRLGRRQRLHPTGPPAQARARTRHTHLGVQRDGHRRPGRPVSATTSGCQTVHPARAWAAQPDRRSGPPRPGTRRPAGQCAAAYPTRWAGHRHRGRHPRDLAFSTMVAPGLFGHRTPKEAGGPSSRADVTAAAAPSRWPFVLPFGGVCP
jgi:hypothetical protein